MNSFGNEFDLLSQLNAGNKAAFTKLYELYSQSLFTSLLKLLKSDQAAEELLQEIFVMIWEKKENHQYSTQYPGIFISNCAK